MFGEYKLVAYIAIGLLLIGTGSAAVLSYNHFVSKSAIQAEQIKAQKEQIAVRDSVINDQMQRQVELKRYQQEADQRSIASENRIKQILSMRSVRDEKGNIAPSDPILAGLNGMYSGNQTVKSPSSGHPPGATMPKKPDASGSVASKKDILPE